MSHYSKIAPYLILFFALLTLCNLDAQPSNNDIRNRIQLHLDASFIASSTINANIEDDCINKKLTSKCLIYHNDQWFVYRPSTLSTAYLRIRNQSCRDSRGVQVVIIEGDPCVISSYKIKNCISKTDLADFLVELDSLQPDRDYLINIDGFLGDQCMFNISITSQPDGLPLDLSTAFPHSVKPMLKESVVTLTWNTDNLNLPPATQFSVYRKRNNETSSVKVNVPSRNNARGLTESEYIVSDTLQKEGTYSYTIVANTQNAVLIIDKTSITYQQTDYASSLSYRKLIPFYLPEAGLVTVTISTEDGKHIRTMKKKYYKGENYITLDFEDISKETENNFKVVIQGRNLDRTYFFKFNKSPSPGSTQSFQRRN